MKRQWTGPYKGWRRRGCAGRRRRRGSGQEAPAGCSNRSEQGGYVGERGRDSNGPYLRHGGLSRSRCLDFADSVRISGIEAREIWDRCWIDAATGTRRVSPNGPLPFQVELWACYGSLRDGQHLPLAANGQGIWKTASGSSAEENAPVCDARPVIAPCARRPMVHAGGTQCDMQSLAHTPVRLPRAITVPEERARGWLSSLAAAGVGQAAAGVRCRCWLSSLSCQRTRTRDARPQWPTHPRPTVPHRPRLP